MIAERPHFAALDSGGFSHWTFYGDALIVSLLLFVGSLMLGLVYVVTVPRLLNVFIKPGKVYPIYGFHYWIHRAIGRISNVNFFIHLFGDSSYIVHYLRAIGYDLSQNVMQTGSNFGLSVKHDNPFLVSIGRGTMIADGLSVVNTQYSNTSFRVARATIGPKNFLGNYIVYPSQGRTGANCLLATKVMVPVEGDVREGVGLLGSPSFEIPRTVRRDIELGQPEQGNERDRKLAAKNKHNLATMGLFLLAQWFLFFLMFLIVFSAGRHYETIGVPIFVLALVFAQLIWTGTHVLVERASALFQALQPKQCSIYDPYFWFHERYWKMMTQRRHLAMFDGTPFKSLIWRLLGVRIGKRVFDDGCYISEKTMVSIGDGSTLNAGSIIQSHSQEDGAFKSDFITIGAGCTLGVNSCVYYGAKMGDGASLAADAFLIKGEEVPPHMRWEGNPASQVHYDDFAEVTVAAVTPHSATAASSVTGGSKEPPVKTAEKVARRVNSECPNRPPHSTPVVRQPQTQSADTHAR
jgi:non-ribosomal peptide synthetase-like protein